MDANCASSGCHSAASHEKNVDLSSYAATKAAGGNASFLGSIQHKSGYKAMPQGGGSLSDAEIKLISCWVQNQMPQ
jgi:mono/diheme cytochrome c family protein